MKKLATTILICLTTNLGAQTNFDNGGSLHNSAYLTVHTEESGHTAQNGYYSTAVNRYTITFNLAQSDIEQVGLAWHIGTSDPDLTQANYSMQGGVNTISVGAKTGWPQIYASGGKSWDQAFSANTTYSFYFYDSHLTTAFDNNNSFDTATERDGKRLYLAMLYYDASDGWELDEISDNSFTNGSSKPYLTFDEIDPTISITDGGDQDLNSSWPSTNNNNFTNLNTYKITVGNEGIASLKITWTKDAGSGASIAETETHTNESASAALTYTQSSLVDGTRYDILYKAIDAAGNIAYYYDYNIWYDTTAPTVTGVHSLETSGATLKVGEVGSFYVQFSEPMDFPVSGASNTISIVRNNGVTSTEGADGDKDGAAVADGKTTLRFDYTVQTNDYSKYFEYENTNALGGGTYRDQAGNALANCSACGGPLPSPPNWGSQATGSNVADFSISNASTGGYFSIDGDKPTGFSIASITPVGGNVVTNYINGVNTGLRFVVNLPNGDETIDGGTLLIEGNYNNNGWGSLYSNSGWTITNAERTAGQKADADVSVSGGSNDLDDLTGWATGNTVQFRVTVTDVNTNAGDVAVYAQTSTIDLFKPKVSSITGAAANTVARTLKSTDTEVFEVNIIDTNSGNSESVTYVDGGNEPTLKLETGTTDAAPEMTDPANNASATKLKFSYTVSDGETTSANAGGLLITHATNPLSVGQGTIRDAAGNDLDTDISGLSSPNILEDANITVDGVKPSIIVLDQIVVAGTDAGDTTVQGYWNQYSDNITFTMAIPTTATDPTLTGGNIQLQVDFDGSYTNLGSSVVIASGDQGNAAYTIDINAATFEGTTGWTNGDQAKFRAIITDVAANSTNGSQAVTTITIDETSPADPTIADTTTIGAPVVDGYFNSHNTGVTVTANIPADGSGSGMVGGKLQFQANISGSGANNWADIGAPKTNLTTSGDAQGLTIDAASLAGHAGYVEDATITYRAVIWDKAGNRTLGSAYTAGTQVIDTTVPTVASVFANTPANPLKIGDSHDITVRMSSNAVISATPKPIIEFDTDNTPGTALGSATQNSVSTTDIVFPYTVGVGEFAINPTYLDVNGASPITLSTGFIRDVAGNNANLDFSGLSTANKLPASLVEVDGIAPTKLPIQSVITIGDTVRTGYWNDDNTSVKVRVQLDNNDATLADGIIQIQGIVTGFGGYESIGAATTILQDSVSIQYQTVEIANTIAGGTKGVEELSNWAQLSTITFRALVYDKAGNETVYDDASTTLIIDENDPDAFTLGGVVTVTDEVVAGYWNEDNTAINVQVPIANDATLENGTVQIQAEADGTFEFIGAGSLNSAGTTISSGDLGTNKTITINGASTLATITELEELTNFSDGDALTFRAIIVDVAGNSRLGGVSATNLIVDQTDPLTPTIVLKSSSDTGIANWDRLTNDATPTFTLTNVTNTDMIHLKVATDAVTLADNTLSILTQSQATSNTIDLTATTLTNGVNYLVTGVAKDLAGNWGLDATTTNVRIDLNPPDVPNAPDLLIDDDRGFENDDNITNVTQPHFIFTGLSNTHDSLRLVIDAGAAAGRDSIMSQVLRDTFRVSTPLASGWHTAGVIAIDSAGNEQNISALLPFVVDNVAPPVPTVPDMTAATDLGMSDTDNITNSQKPNFDITNLEVGSALNLYHENATPVLTLAHSDTIAVGVTTTTRIPDINMADGTYRLYATAEDTAGNISQSNDLSNVIIDATVPTIIANYHNKTIQTVYNGFTNKVKDDSIRAGKGGDEVDFIAIMSEPAGTSPEPTLDVTYGNSATPAVDDMAKTTKANNNATWSWKVTLPAGITNNGAAKVEFTAYDVAGNLAVTFTDTQKFTVDNTPPSAFTTGLATTLGDTNVSMVVESKTGWFINNKTDRIEVLTPISTTDNSLVNGGYVDIQARVRNKMVNTWASINSNVTANPFFPHDSTEGVGASIPFYRKKLDITTELTGNGLLQGDTIDVRAMLYDRALNSTAGTQSESFFVLDTIPPTIGTFITDTLYTLKGKTTRLRVNQDSTWTNDTISFAVKDWVDPGSSTEKPSGIQRYEYALYQSTTTGAVGAGDISNYSLFRDFKNQINLLDSVFIDTFALTHDRNYFVRVRGVDVAGNTSLTNSNNSKSDYVLRHNARPEVEAISEELIAKEDVLLEQLLTVNDKDLLTLRSDKFTYALTTIKLDTTKTPIDSSVVTNLTAAVSTSGKISFTPTKLDTGKYVFTTIVYDNWKNSLSQTGLNLADTSYINIRVLAVNDPPILDLSSITKLNFLEGANSDSINLTRYVSDEDNDTLSIKFSFRIASKIPANIGYPTAKFGFLSDFTHDFKKSFINDLVDEFPTSTIIQKNGAFIVYAANVYEFRDPLKVDSLRQVDSLYTWITQTDTTSADTNYYTESDMIVEFTATDPGGLEGKDTVTFFINPLNDPPVWAGLPDTVVKENDSLYLDFANYLTDVDDSTLTISILPLTYDNKVTVEPTKTFEKKATGYIYSSKARKDTVKFKPAPLWYKKDSGPWNPSDTSSNQIKFKITAADEDTSAIDEFVIKVQRVPRPEIRMYVVQNNAFTNYYEIFLIDSVGKTKDLTLNVQSRAVTLDTAAAYTYVGHYDFKTKGNYTFEVVAKGVVGDTTITNNVGLTLAKMYGTWLGRSADGQFQVVGQNGSVDFDQSIMILDSTMFDPHFNDRASYLLGNEAFRFKKSVEISIPGDDDEMAIYQRTTGSGWVELPSITTGNRVNAYSEKMGYFRMGPKTLIVPGQTSLKQNYPNPFNPVTTIEYDLGFIDGPIQRVNVTIYDILGRNVKTLISEEQSIGRYTVKWNGKDSNGVPMSSGVYFVHMLTDMGRSQTKKIMLVR